LANAEEYAFWESHDSTEFIDWRRAEQVRLPNLRPSTKTWLAEDVNRRAR
jgi:hypothetical protein